MITTCFVFSILNNPIAWSKDLDASDNKAPVLISISIDKHSLVEGETGTVTVVIRDDKNEMQGWPTVLFGAPTESPGSISGGIFAGGGKGLTDTRLSPDYVEQTFQFTYTAPSWPGQYYGFNIQGVRDKNGNAIGFDLKRCDNKNIYSNPQLVSFPNITPTCDTNFTVRLLTAEEKAQKEKAALDKLMADKAAADKLLSDSQARINLAFAAFSQLDAEVDSLMKKYPSMKTELNLYKKKIALFDEINEKNIGTAELNLAGITSKIVSIKATYIKIARSLTCIKGSKTVKVVDVKPVCPKGYKKK
jgi:hypothetical protein